MATKHISPCPCLCKMRFAGKHAQTCSKPGLLDVVGKLRRAKWNFSVIHIFFDSCMLFISCHYYFYLYFSEKTTRHKVLVLYCHNQFFNTFRTKTISMCVYIIRVKQRLWKKREKQKRKIKKKIGQMEKYLCSFISHERRFIKKVCIAKCICDQEMA